VLACRTIYTLKEADPHSWAIPRLRGRAKAALVEIQADEYGGGRPDRMHASIFAKCLTAAGLDARYGAYADLVPATVYTSMNVMSFFGLHRRWRGAIVGHLAAYEMTSTQPCRAYARGLRRLGFPDDVVEYFDEHVEADAVHEQLAARDLAGGLAETEPALVDDILFGASACLTIDGRLWSGVRAAFERGESALRTPSP
jgi:pyrroloquinoline quinone (PQQ) biosynthesis protein C